MTASKGSRTLDTNERAASSMRYSLSMHRVVLLLVAACASAPLRPLPPADWARGSTAWVHPPPSVEIGAQQSQDELRSALKSGIEEDLSTAGFRIGQPDDRSELRVILRSTLQVGAPSKSILEASVDRSGAPLESFSFDAFQLPCWSTYGSTPRENMRCVGREVAARVLESRAVASAMARKPAPPAAVPGRLSGKLAVLELRNFAKDLTRENAQYFTDVVRSAALTAQPQLQVMTRENLLVLLQASGKDLANCEGECEVDTGRRIGADEIVSGELQKVGTRYKLTLRLHDTREGRLLSSTQASGKTIEELDDATQKAAADLLSGR